MKILLYCFQGHDYAELAFCYFKTNKDRDPRGWIYLKDVTDISDDEKCFVVISQARTMIIEAQSLAEYSMWLNALVELCPSANTTNIQCEFCVSILFDDSADWVFVNDCCVGRALITIFLYFHNSETCTFKEK